MNITAKIPGHNISYGQYAAYRRRQQGGKGSQYGPELHTDANAISDPNGNEANATTGWSQTDLDTGSNVFASQGSVVHTGSYAFHASSTPTPDGGALFTKTFTVENGSDYLITFYWRHDGTGLSTASWRYNVDAGAIANVTTSDTSFIPSSNTITATSTSMVVEFRELNANNDGGVYLDNFSIKKVF